MPSWRFFSFEEPEWLDRVAREDLLDRQPEQLADAESQLEARVVFAPLQVPDGLVVDAQRRGQVVAAQVPLQPQDGQAVVEPAGQRGAAPRRRIHTTNNSINTIERSSLTREVCGAT